MRAFLRGMYEGAVLTAAVVLAGGVHRAVGVGKMIRQQVAGRLSWSWRTWPDKRLAERAALP
jgi:hypothetical protein